MSCKNFFAKKLNLFKNKTSSPCPSTDCVDSDCGSESDFGDSGQWESSGPRKLFTKGENLKDKLVGVVVTIFEGSSYDEMFREVMPQTVPGERVSTYSISCRDVKLLNDYLSATVPVPADQPLWTSLVSDINAVQADSVTFNWECCSACGDCCFPCATEATQNIDIDMNSNSEAQTQDLSWTCAACTLQNDASASACAACDTARPWFCAACTFENVGAASTCGACDTVRPAAPEPESEASQEPANQEPQRRHSDTLEFMALAVRRGHTVMCSDFSLKSLLHDWSEQHLGPNPFKQVGEIDRHFQLEFVASDLTHEDVPQQLQVVGELCRERGQAVVKAMGGTILYTVDPNRPPTGAYDLKILTVVTSTADGLPNLTDEMKCSIGEGKTIKKGAAGHVTLTYPSGGQLVTSMGHWIELTRLNTTVEEVLHAAEHNFGVTEAADFRTEYYSKCSDTERAECLQKRASKLVQQSVPTKMKCRTKF